MSNDSDSTTGNSSGPHLHFTPSDVPPEPQPTAHLAAYVVAGRQAVDGVRRRGRVQLDPEDPRTERLLAAGHIKPATAPAAASTTTTNTDQE